MANRCWVPHEYLANSNSHLSFEFKGEIKFKTNKPIFNATKPFCPFLITINVHKLQAQEVL